MVRPLLAVVVLMSLAACGGGSGGGDPAAPALDTSTPPVVGPPPDTLLDGVWESACFAAAPPASSRRYVVSVTDTAFSFGDTTYGDAGCSEQSALREISTRGSFTEQLPEDGRRIEDGIPVDLAVEQVILIPRQTRVAQRYNELMLCEAVAADWTAGVSQDISGCADGSGTIDVDTTAPRVDFNLFLVDDAGSPDERGDDRLLLGTVDAQPDPAQRPLAVSQEPTFTRRPGSL